ncbi:hypothetical protein H6G80_35790 [Nostoc sp. FACHB-87]|uniref:hypothetical protein n=1 Tax=Nostocaceae TaxID=1162 RepID=UPI0016861AAC|nr:MULTISPECIES: hypothetical protein [Nostocaceae]MBD2303874.1 hypothetical protein [Nostoc sp. FACHB-190]MBD2459374.1 hypothetical protein [Nostoc sp. FACHB-87]MBD2480367.1 hypothetical protein [Anabaena sp. FACHB-83]
MYNSQILALMIQHEIDYPEAAMMLQDIEWREIDIVVSEEEIQRQISSSSSDIQPMNFAEEIPF